MSLPYPNRYLIANWCNPFDSAHLIALCSG